MVFGTSRHSVHTARIGWRVASRLSPVTERPVIVLCVCVPRAVGVILLLAGCVYLFIITIVIAQWLGEEGLRARSIVW